MSQEENVNSITHSSLVNKAFAKQAAVCFIDSTAEVFFISTDMVPLQRKFTTSVCEQHC